MGKSQKNPFSDILYPLDEGFLESEVDRALCSADLLVLVHIEDISSEIVDSPYPWETLRIEVVCLRSEVIRSSRSSSTLGYSRSE